MKHISVKAADRAPDMNFPVTDIVPLIPQKPPFVMVGKLLFTDFDNSRSSFLIDSKNVFVKDGLFQEAGIIENIAQTVALGAGYVARLQDRPVLSGYIAAINKLEIFSLPANGDEIITETTVENRIFSVSVISGKVWNNGQLIASGHLKLFSVNM